MSEPESRRHTTSSGIEIHPVYQAADLDGFDAEDRLGAPGSFPFTRGIHREMYRARLWTMRQYAGFASAAETKSEWRRRARAEALRA